MVRDRCGDGRVRSKHSIALPKSECSAVVLLKREKELAGAIKCKKDLWVLSKVSSSKDSRLGV